MRCEEIKISIYFAFGATNEKLTPLEVIVLPRGDGLPILMSNTFKRKRIILKFLEKTYSPYSIIGAN